MPPSDPFAPDSVAVEMHSLLTELFPICRSITGDGVRETLKAIQRYVPLQVYEVPSGTKAFDWVVPVEWNIRDAFVEDSSGIRIIDFSQNNLHVVGYSEPVDRWVSLAELNEHLFSVESQPDAIPYVTSYYARTWGFCITHAKRLRLNEGEYHVVIDSDLEDGHLTYGELLIPGESEREIFLSTYVCHPSMANNELSGPVVLTFLAQWLMATPRRYSYRMVFVPETIGSLVYLSRHLDAMKKNVEIAFNVSCVGDERDYSFVASRYGDTIADRIANNVLRSLSPDFTRYSYLKRGSDERQYGSPGVNLPVVSLCRSKYGTYPEYHTSLDDSNLVTPAGLSGGYKMVQTCVLVAEANANYRMTVTGEPQLGARGLYPTVSHKGSADSLKSLMDFMAYADGQNDLIAISDLIGVPTLDLIPLVDQLLEHGLIEKVD